MTRDELAIAVQWAAAEGWNPGLHDVDCFYAADPSGFLMGFLGDEPIASISVVKYDDTFGFLGFYIVKPEYRGQGYGIQLWRTGVSYLKGCNIGLDGVVEQQENYVRSGFQLAHRNIRYEGFSRLGQDVPDAGELSADVKIISLDSVSLKAISNYDSRFFPAKREDFLRGWIHSPQHVALGLQKGNELMGYGVLRPCQQGYKIGPLFAESRLFAEHLLLAFVTRIESDTPFYLDVPATNTAAVALAEKYTMNRVFETARMYTQQPPSLSLNRTFGITTFELG